MSVRSPEVLKVARLLKVEPDEVAFLEKVPEAQLAGYRQELSDHLFWVEPARLKSVVDIVRILPVALTAKLCGRVAPILSGRLTAELDPDRAASISARLPVRQLAAIAGELEPAKAVAVLQALPSAMVRDTAVLLAEQQEHVVMGRFVGHLEEPVLRECIEALDDRDALLSAYTIDGEGAVDRVMALLDDDRLLGLRAVAEAEGLDEVLAAVLTRLGPDQAARVALLEGQR